MEISPPESIGRPKLRGRRLRQRKSQTGGGTPVATAYIWCGASICQARTAAGAVSKEYFSEGELAPGATAQAYYYGIDQIGSVRRAFASAGSAPAYSYGPYGVPLQTTAPVTDIGYAGLFYNADSGLYLTNYRAYDPTSGRWLSRDPLGEAADPSSNLYAYVGGDPLNREDPLGLYPDVVVTLANGGKYTPMTSVKNSAQSRAFGLPIGTPIAIAVPPNVNPQQIVNDWNCAPLKGPLPFGWFWRPNGPNDYKSISPMYDAFGNFEYGATGSAADYSAQVLQWAGNMLHNGNNSPLNVNDIQSGFNAIANGGTISVGNYDPPRH